MTAPQIRIGQVVLQDAQPTGQIRVGDVRLAQPVGPQLRIGTVQLLKPSPPQIQYTVISTVGTDQSVPLGVTVAISASDPLGGQLQYRIDWGDGTAPATGPLTSTTDPIASHTYTATGTYQLVASVTAPSSLTASLTSPVTVFGPARRWIFAVKTPGGTQPLLFKGVMRGGQVQPLQFDGLVESGALVDPNTPVQGG